jgi:hypothetical protein
VDLQVAATAVYNEQQRIVASHIDADLGQHE